MMPDRETVITHLQIIHTWAAFARERDLHFFTPKHLEDIAQWSDDAIALMQEQEHKDRMYHALEDDWKRLKELLEKQDEEHRRLLSWLGKFCRHIDNGDAWLTDEENIAFFKEKMKQQFGWDID